MSLKAGNHHYGCQRLLLVMHGDIELHGVLGQEQFINEVLALPNTLTAVAASVSLICPIKPRNKQTKGKDLLEDRFKSKSKKRMKTISFWWVYHEGKHSPPPEILKFVYLEEALDSIKAVLNRAAFLKDNQIVKSLRTKSFSYLKIQYQTFSFKSYNVLFMNKSYWFSA